MKKVAYPLNRAVKYAEDIAAFGKTKHPNIFKDANFHGVDYLKNCCKEMGISLMEDKKLPGAKRKAVAMDVKGRPFIILDASLQHRDEKSIYPLAHEIAHIILGHFVRNNFTVLGFSETMNAWDADLQPIYCLETELEADLLAMMIILPDSYLDGIVEKEVFIPAQNLADEHRLNVKWVAARIQLYRAMYGYERSKALLRKHIRDEFSQTDYDRWFSIEQKDNNDLESFLPRVDPYMLNYLY